MVAIETCADGRKFGKTEGNSVWLSPEKTSPYSFYQFWLNQTDEDAESFIKKFTLIPIDEIKEMIEEHRKCPSARLLQKELAKYMTTLVHSERDYLNAVEASEILFGKGTTDSLKNMDEETFLSVMKDVSKVEVKKSTLDGGMTMLDLASLHSKVNSKSEARKLIKSNGFSLNKERVTNEKDIVYSSSLIGGRYLLLQKGRKEYTVVVVS